MVEASKQGRISDETRDQILDRTDIVDLIDESVPLTKQGKNFSACCPFHEEKTPSFVVSPEKQEYTCYGCGASGNAITFLMDYDKLSFPQAVRELGKKAGITVESIKPAVDADKKREMAESFNAVETASKVYQSNLKARKNPEVNETLVRRGLTQETIDTFRIGAAMDSWNDITARFGGYEKAEILDNSGLAVYSPRSEGNKAKLYDRFRNGIVFPIFNEKGSVISFSRRVLKSEEDAANGNRKIAKYINGPETSIFKKINTLYGLYQALDKNPRPDQFIVTEGYMDVCMSHQHGITETVASMGTAISELNIKKLMRYTPNITFAFDGDKAGDEASLRALTGLLPNMTADTNAKFVFLPKGEDPDSMLKRDGEDRYREYLASNSLSASQFILAVSRKGVDITTHEGRARFFDKATGYINLMPASAIKARLLQEVSDISGVRPKEVLPLSMGCIDGVDLFSLADKVTEFIAKETGSSREAIKVNFTAPLVKPTREPVIANFKGVDVATELKKRGSEVTRVLKMDSVISEGLTLADVYKNACVSQAESKLIAKVLLGNYLSQSTAFEAQTNQVLENLRAVRDCMTELCTTGRSNTENLSGMISWVEGVEDRVPLYGALAHYTKDDQVEKTISRSCEGITQLCNSMKRDWILDLEEMNSLDQKEVNEVRVPSAVR